MSFIIISFDNYDNSITLYNNNLLTLNFSAIFILSSSQSTFYNNLINFIYFDIFGLFFIDVEFFNVFINLDKGLKRNKRARFKNLKFKR